ncbi:hypothetical protein ILYODFUR_005882 [Ilyodon furcidens]|uniref:Cadherin domain-containing protein n=1 Tax=Ilyodon furcidens TaxID=33524 RepID=A0ABV0T5K2_9TELE
METTGHLRKVMISSLLVMVFNVVVSHEPFLGNPENLSIKGEFSDIVDEQHKLASWELKHGAVSSLPHSRWQTQMAFSKTAYSFQVNEDTVPGTLVGKLEAQLGSPTPITFSVQEDDGESMFLLSPVSGEFLLSRSLDFETQRFYILTVEVQQGDSQVSSVRVYFNVLDVNDNPPVFSQNNFFASLLEDTHVRTCFLSLNVSDKDDGKSPP